MKKIVAIIFCILTLTAVLSLSGCGDGKPEASPIEDFTYEFEDGEVTITGYSGTDLDIVVPDVIEERPVTTIGETAFSGYDMKSIVIPEGVTTINRKAFSRCSMLENITLPDSLKSIYDLSESGLSDTKWYENQPDGILYINNVLIGYKGNKDNMPSEIIIKDGTVCVADSAFLTSKNITNLIIPNSVKYIGNKAFHRCENLKIVNIPESVEEIGVYAFGYVETVGRVGYQYDYIQEPVEGFEIHGKAGSAAEEYANKEKLPFVAQ